LEGLQLGTIEASITPAELYVGVDPRFQIPAVPALFDTMQDARDTLDDPKVREHLLNLAAGKGIVGFALLVYGPQTINTRELVEDLDDLAGKRIRVLASETETGAVEALGAAAVPMPLNEVSAALQQGAIDGLSTVIDVFVALKTHDTAPYILDTRLWYLNSIASVSKAWLDSLPPDLQEAVKQTGVDLEDEMFQWQLEQDEANRATWKEQGGTITPLSDEDREEAEAAVAQVTEAFLERHPELRETYDLLANAGQD
ncbi:MAG TPA: TRAP transporter substrate-binding protein, partial [Geminicoccaceae bacterium]